MTTAIKGSTQLSKREVIARLHATRERLRTYQPENVVEVVDEVTGERRTLYSAQPKQDELHKCRAPFVLFGGAAGGSKSHGIRWHAILACLRIERCRVLILRRELTELKRNHIDRIQIELPPEIATYNQNDAVVKFHANGSLIQFGHSHNERDVTKYLSDEWDLIIIDESSEFTPWQLQMLSMRLRSSSVRPVSPQMVLATNPGGEAHTYHVELFIEKTNASELINKDEYDRTRYHFIQALVSDNAYITDEYITILASLAEPLRSAYLEGKWTVFAGQFFREWDATLHVRRLKEIPEWYELGAGFDWGYDPDPFYLVLMAFDEYGRGYAFREVTGTLRTPRECAEDLVQQIPEARTRTIIVRCDPSMKAKNPNSDHVSIMNQINDRLAELGSNMTLVPANNDRPNGWMRYRQFLDPRRPAPDSNARGPWLVYAEPDSETGYGTPYLIGTIGAQRHDEKRPGDMKGSSNDHGVDGNRYCVMGREPLSVMPDRKADSAADAGRARGAKYLAQRVAATALADDAVESGVGPLLESDDTLIDDSDLLQSQWH